MQLAPVSLDDKYRLESGRIYLTGSQALVRLPMMQRRRDLAAGLNTACFISGYRGSPMHAVDQQLWRAPKFLDEYHVRFQPGLNEDSAATAVWGSQQAGLFGDSKYDGVFAMWYGKGPGLDRSIDAIRHAHYAGTARHGGVLALVGDDHGMRSTDVPATSEPTFHDLLMPILYPANVQEVLDFGLYGWALSRFCGSWVGMKMIFETVDTSASVHVDPARVSIVLPEDVTFPPDGVSIRVPDVWLNQEPRHRTYKIPAARAFGRANHLNRVVLEGPRRRFGIVASGKAYLDVLQALRELGISQEAAAQIGITILKIGMPFPMDHDVLRAFGAGLEEVLIVEEKRRLIETEVKDALYSLPESRRPRVIGRFDEQHRPLLPELGELTSADVTLALARRLAPMHQSERMAARVAFLEAQQKRIAEAAPIELKRTPYFCSGCPHNTSTRVPEGSRAQGGVGCHFMATYMDRNTHTHTHMGGEGVTWIGAAPFVNTKHVFQNMGDGTYLHSGLLAIRAAVAAKVNITYKVLFNDAVAMTGGQPVDGPLSVPMIAQQVRAEGVERIAVVSDEPDKYPLNAGFPGGVTFHHRRDLDRVQRELREIEGVTVLIYDQTCAAEKRRRRKRGAFPDPQKRMFINERVCEGCGDCSAKSNCLSVIPVETEFGRKRRIDQSNCNKDYSCAEGFCPSFVAVLGGGLRKAPWRTADSSWIAKLPEPALSSIGENDTYRVLVTGVGGTGVVTIGALLGMASHLEGKGVAVVDQLGMAQKGGAVISHVQIAARPDDIATVRLSRGDANLLLGCDMLVAGSEAALETIDPEKTRAVINTHESITGDFTRNPGLVFPSDALEARIADTVGRQHTSFIDATRLATRLLGDSLATNLFMLGYAFQKGLLPVSAAAIERAVELNGAAIDWNKQAFAWGRRAVVDPAAVEAAAKPVRRPDDEAFSGGLDDLLARRIADLTAYQDSAYARRYADFVEEVRRAEQSRGKGLTGLTEAVARNLYKLMAYKDEYEVARLYTDGAFLRRLNEEFEGDFKLQFHMAPPLLARRDPDTGQLQKRTFGPWMLTALRLVARLRRLRGTWLDPFGHTEERRAERRLIADYEATVRSLLQDLTPENHQIAVQIASIPDQIRGFGHVKQRSLEQARDAEAALLQRFRDPEAPRAAAE